MSCSCGEIQAADPRRHFKGCPERKPLPDQAKIDELYAMESSGLCAGGCGKQCLPGWMCPGCLGGARILNRNALDAARNEKDTLVESLRAKLRDLPEPKVRQFWIFGVDADERQRIEFSVWKRAVLRLLETL